VIICVLKTEILVIQGIIIFKAHVCGILILASVMRFVQNKIPQTVAMIMSSTVEDYET
jgi:hypothetical protein